MFLFGAWLLPVGVFLIHYVGLAYSPLQAIGWASIFADFGGVLVILSTLAYLFGVARHLRQPEPAVPDDGLLKDPSAAGRMGPTTRELISTGTRLWITRCSRR